MNEEIHVNMERQYYLKHPKDQLFYRILISMLTLVGLGNPTLWGYAPPNKILPFNGWIVKIFSPVCLVTQIVYLVAYRSELSFDVLGIIFSIVPVAVLVNVNVISAKFASYKKIMWEFMDHIHLHNQYKTKNVLLEKKIINVERATRWTAYYLIFFFSLNWVFWIWIPVLNNIKNVEQIHNRTMSLQTCIYMWMPFDYNYNYRNWVVTHTANVYTVACGVTVMMLFHTVNYMFIYHLIGHIQLIKYKIETEFSRDLNDEETRGKLIEVIKYHDFILRTFKDVQSAFGFNIITNYLHNLVSDSLIMYQIMYGGKENIILYIVMVVVYMGGLILMSFVLEEMRRQTEDLSDVVYSIPWEHMSVSNQKYLILIIKRMQPPLIFKALGGFVAGVTPMISILKTTFSYYVMLESTMAEK